MTLTWVQAIVSEAWRWIGGRLIDYSHTPPWVGKVQDVRVTPDGYLAINFGEITRIFDEMVADPLAGHDQLYGTEDFVALRVNQAGEAHLFPAVPRSEPVGLVASAAVEQNTAAEVFDILKKAEDAATPVDTPGTPPGFKPGDGKFGGAGATGGWDPAQPGAERTAVSEIDNGQVVEQTEAAAAPDAEA